MSLCDLLMEGDIVTMKTGIKYVYLYPKSKNIFSAKAIGYHTECKFKDIDQFEHYDRNFDDQLIFKVKTAMMHLSKKARISKTTKVIEDSLLDFGDIGYYKVIFEGNSEIFKVDKREASKIWRWNNRPIRHITHKHIDKDAQLIFATNGIPDWL